MAKTGYKHLLPRLPAHDSAAWALHERLAKQAAEERAAANAVRAERERQAVVDKANAERAAGDKATADKIKAMPARNGVSAHFD